MDNSLTGVAASMTDNIFAVKQAMESMKNEGETVQKLIDDSESIREEINSMAGNEERVGGNIDIYA
ncbi:MAG: hypothetical protein E3K37_04585 [Candidatus Kuenenia sp.]|nr:hypothetical protein [Candidatus Kuenenia hertensis]